MSRPEEISRALAALAQMPRTELAACWEVAFQHPAPPRVHSTLLRCALAWDLQMKASDWTPARIRKLLRQAADGDAVAQPGTRLVREWQGRMHQVTVLPSGYDYEGTFYSSLTAIARKITGISWSGPRFFGLKS
jgi:Protein of unknown function (DUF2924)